MTTQNSATRQVTCAAIRDRIDAVLAEFLEGKSRQAAARNHPAEITDVLHDFLFAGGKRLRPVLCVLGYHAVRGHRTSAPVAQVAASLELFHAFCLIHDDVMDHSATRRGRPTVHRTLAVRHHDHPAAAQLGTSAAILTGDLALVWSDELLATGHLTRTQRAAIRPLVDAMRTEVMYGQYLDLTATGQPTANTGTALEIIRYKTAKYTVERPLHIGAALAGADKQFFDSLSAFALPLGEAFQMRDDLLGVFGTPAETGKPALDDLREGKHTVLAALALMNADITQTRLLRAGYGNPHLTEDNAATLRAVLKATGAAQTVEDMIRARYTQALTALRDVAVPEPVGAQLRALAETAVWRRS
ncbi:polyprenyl synthetase family protein [Streptomyces luteireticuli]|uniref:polyprenyl synthetase family protein n=1 Tax=Streptomyces luteireticuli TaxID=173858 RepID=UPI0035584D5B